MWCRDSNPVGTGNLPRVHTHIWHAREPPDRLSDTCAARIAWKRCPATPTSSTVRAQTSRRPSKVRHLPPMLTILPHTSHLLRPATCLGRLTGPVRDPRRKFQRSWALCSLDCALRAMACGSRREVAAASSADVACAICPALDRTHILRCSCVHISGPV